VYWSLDFSLTLVCVRVRLFMFACVRVCARTQIQLFSKFDVRRMFWNVELRQSGRVCKYTDTRTHAHTHSHKHTHFHSAGRLRLKCDGTRAETRFRVSANRTSPFKSAGASVQSTTGGRSVRISGSNAGYTMF